MITAQTAPSGGIPVAARRRSLVEDARRSLAGDMTGEAWRGLVTGLLEFLEEESREPEHAIDWDAVLGDEPFRHTLKSGRWAARLRALAGDRLDGDPLEWGSDLDDLPVDTEHDGPWMSCMARDGSRMYCNRNLPSSVEIAGQRVDVADMLKHHEAPEWVRIRQLLAELGREPTEDERVAIYERAHHEAGTPGEREQAKAMGVDWPAWSAWCRGVETKLEKGPFANPPEDADVTLAPHHHGDLEVTGDAKLPHDEVSYGPSTGRDRCDGCANYEPDGPHCLIVADPIEAGGWCDRFASPTNVAMVPLQKVRLALGAGLDSALLIALDRASVRSFDQDGRMRVAKAHISKANVCPYRGEEIPRWRELGLEPQKIYHLYRDPEELERAAPSSNGVQILRKHVAVNAEDPQQWDVVGATLSDGEFNDPYLDNGLSIWTKEGIEGIESGRRQELSMGYHYRADMTPGQIGGIRFDGVMRDIVVNHVALVEDGRAGDDVLVGDSTEGLMKKPTRLAALAVGFTHRAIAPLLALDQKVDLLPIFRDVDSKSFDAKKLSAAVASALKGKTIAKDANVEHISTMLDALEHAGKKEPVKADESVSEPQHKAMMAAANGESNLGIPKSVGEEFKQADKGKTFSDADPASNLGEYLKGKGMSEDDVNGALAMLNKQKATDEESESEEDKKKREEDERRKAAAASDNNGGKGMMISKDEMDQAIQAAVAAERRSSAALHAALDFVRPWVGDIPPALGLDSAEKVHRQALKMMSVEGAETIHASALATIIGMQPKAGARPGPQRERALGMDAAGTKAFSDRFADAGRIGSA